MAVKEFPAVYRRFYRNRRRIEATFSQSKNGHVKLRLRAHENPYIKSMTYPYDMKQNVPKDVRRFRETLHRIIAKERIGLARRNEGLAKASRLISDSFACFPVNTGIALTSA